MTPGWQVILTRTARAQLAQITDTRERAAIARVIDLLATDPDKRGKALGDELAGFRSIRAAGQRYRVIYKVVADQVIVYVVQIGRRAEGSRRDVYAQAAGQLADWTVPESPEDDGDEETAGKAGPRSSGKGCGRERAATEDTSMTQDALHYSMILAWDPRNAIIVVTVPELPGCRTHGRTYEEALQMGRDAIEGWLEVQSQMGRSIPQPRTYDVYAAATA